MNPNELRALADALQPMAAAPCFDGIDIERAADYLRACADAQPVAWLYRDWANVLKVLQLGPHEDGAFAVFAAPQPQAEPIADSDADYWLRNRQAILDAIERAGFVLMSNASGFWLHPRGTTDAQAEPKREPLTYEQLVSACYTYRHDFGLLDPDEQHLVIEEAGRWAKAFGIGGRDE